MVFETIEYKENEYLLRDIKLPEFGFVYIAGTSLQNLLFNEDDVAISDEAEYVDEKIFFYVEDKYLELSDVKLKKLLIEYDI